MKRPKRRIPWAVLAILGTGLLPLAACTPSVPSPKAITPTVTLALAPSPEPPTALPTQGGTGGTVQVTVYFNNSNLNPGMIDCSKVFPVVRTVPAGPDLVTAALKELFAGPTDAEVAEGYVSLFSPATRDILIRVKVQGDTAYVDLMDIRSLIPSASASCGSADFFAEVGNTVKAAAPVQRVLYAIEGDPAPFYEWTQIGCAPENDNCDPAPFTSP